MVRTLTSNHVLHASLHDLYFIFQELWTSIYSAPYTLVMLVQVHNTHLYSLVYIPFSLSTSYSGVSTLVPSYSS